MYIGKYVHPDGGEMNGKVEKLNVRLGVYVHGHNMHTYLGMTEIMWLILLFFLLIKRKMGKLASYLMLSWYYI